MSGPDDDRGPDREEEGRERAGPSAPGRLDQVRTDREIAAELRLRPERPRVMRLSRRVLATLGGVSAIAVAGALTFALWPHGAKGPAQELYSTDNRQTPDGLNGLPRDYSGLPKPVPQLGAPLPGDLGKPILNAGASAPGMPAPTQPDPEAQRLAQERQRLAQEMDAARTSRLFASEARAATQSAAATGSGLQGATAPLLDQAALGPNVGGASKPTESDRKLAFLNGPVDRRVWYGVPQDPPSAGVERHLLHPSPWRTSATTSCPRASAIPGRRCIDVAVSGCTVGPNFEKPVVASPGEYAPAPGLAASTTYGGAVDVTWWRSFGDPQLTVLVERLGAQNLDLQAAAERIAQARARVRISGAGRLPQVDAQGSYNRERASESGFERPPPGAPYEANVFDLGGSASWELDLFGRVRREVESSRATASAAVEDRHAIALAAIAELAQDYMNLRQYQAEIALLTRNVDVARKRSVLVRQLSRAGAGSSLEVAQAEAQITTIEQTLPGLLEEEAAFKNAIALLLALPPRSLEGELSIRPGIQPAAPPRVPVGVPADLIRQRPDIRRAEARLHAATADTGVAVASFYPDISLSGSFSFNSIKGSSLFDWASRMFGIGPAISLPIFEGGQLRGNLQLAKATQREAAITFRQTVLQSWHDVDNALTAYARAQQRRDYAVATRTANERVLAIGLERYRAGAAGFLDVVEAQSALIASENDIVEANAAFETALIQLYKALGGGWQAVPDAATQAVARP